MSSCRLLCIRTLKQTSSEKGIVSTTRIHDSTTRIVPQVFDSFSSSAGSEKKKTINDVQSRSRRDEHIFPRGSGLKALKSLLTPATSDTATFKIFRAVYRENSIPFRPARRKSGREHEFDCFSSFLSVCDR